MNLSTLFFSVIIIGIFSSCNPFESSKEIRKIDSLHQEIKLSLNEFRQVDTASLNSSYEELLSNTKYIQKHNIDTLSLKLAQLLSEYYSMRRLIEAIENYDSVEEELLISLQQLEDLKHDFENDIIDQKKFREYYTIESNNFLMLQTKVVDMLNDWERFQDKFPQYNPVVDSLVNAIRTKRNSLKL